MFGVYMKFTAQPGQREALMAHLLNAANSLRAFEGCYLYVINSVPDEANVVWVTEVWRSEADQQASLANEGTKAAIMAVRPLIADIARTVIEPRGGKGLPIEG